MKVDGFFLYLYSMTKKKKYILYKFVKFVEKELNIKNPFKVTTSYDHDKFKTTAYYNNGTGEVAVYVKGRAIIDILRSIAHELVHHRQFETGEIKNGEQVKDIGGKIEDDANAIAGQLVKKFTYENEKLKLFNESIKKKSLLR